MNILLVTSDAHGCSGGIAQYNRDLVDALTELSSTSRVTVIARNLHFSFSDLPEKSAFIYEATRGRSSFFCAIIGQIFRKNDLVICGHINLLPLAALLAIRFSCPLVLLAYGIEVWNAPTSLIIRCFAKRIDTLWSISNFTQSRVKKWLQLPADAWVLLPNAIRLERYGQRPISSEFSQSLRGNASHMILTLGRLASSERYKGIDEILDVLPALLRIYPKLIYVVAGEGDDRPRLEAKSVMLGIASNVRFVGFVREEDKADLYRISDVFAMPGRGEGFGFVFLEALACGTPVIASILDGSFEAVRGGSIGYAIDPRDPQALLRALLSALSQIRSIPDGLSFFSFATHKERLAIAIARLQKMRQVILENTQ